MKARLSFATALAVLVAAASGPARADDATDVEELLAEPVVDAASRTRETSTFAPATSSVVTADELRRHGIRSLSEALNYLSLGMTTTAPLHAVEIGARGVLLNGDYGNHVLLLLDGHTLNEPWNGTAYFERGAAIPLELVDHIEIILGPGSVTYGSAAMLGVINVVTKRAKDYPKLQLVFDSEIATMWKAAAGGGHTFDLLGKRAEIVGQMELVKQDGPDFTFGPQRHGDDSVTGQPKRFADGAGTGIWGGRATRSYYSRVPAGYVRFTLDKLEVGLRAAAYERATPYIDSTVNRFGDFDDPNDRETDRWVSADVRYGLTLSSIADLRVRAYADAYDYTMRNTSHAAEDCAAGLTSGCRERVYGASKWAGAEAMATFDWTKDGRFTTLAGTEARVQHVGSSVQQTDLATREVHPQPGGFDETTLRLAAFADQRARPLRWMWATAGARGDVAEGYRGALSPRASVGVEPWRGGTVKLIYAEAFRAPSAYERRYSDASQVAAGDLSPERVRTAEATVEQRAGTHRVLFGVFRSWWSDLVTLHRLSLDEVAAVRGAVVGDEAVYRFANVDSIDSWGWELGSRGGFFRSRFEYGANVTGAYSRRQTDAGRTPLPVAPALFGNARVSYRLLEDGPTLALAGLVGSRRPADRAFDGDFKPIPYAPPRLSVRAALSGKAPFAAGLSYRVTADYAFSTTGEYVVGPLQSGDGERPAELSPMDRFRVGVGLIYAVE